MNKRDVKLNEADAALAAIVSKGQTPLKEAHEAYKTISKKDVSFQYVAQRVKRLVEEGVFDYESGEGNSKIVKMADDVTLEETDLGPIASVPAPVMATPESRLKQVLELFNVKGDIQKKVISILAINPGMDNPQSLFGVLTNLRVEPSVARNVTETFYGAKQYAEAALRGFGPGPNPGFGYGYAPQGSGFPIAPYGGASQPVMTYGPGGQPIVVYPQSVPVQPQQQQPQAPVVIKTGETRKIRRPIRDAKGKIQKDDETGEALYEEVEEPVTAVVGGGSSTESSLLKLLIESGGLGGGGKYREKYEEEKDKRFEEKIAAVQKETSDNLSGLIASVNKNQKDLVEKMMEQMEKMNDKFDRRLEDIQKDTQHRAELEAVRGSAGERPIVSLTKELGKAVRDGFGEIRQTVQTIARPGMPGMPPPGQMTPEQMAEEARKIRERVASH